MLCATASTHVGACASCIAAVRMGLGGGGVIVGVGVVSGGRVCGLILLRVGSLLAAGHLCLLGARERGRGLMVVHAHQLIDEVVEGVGILHRVATHHAVLVIVLRLQD